MARSRWLAMTIGLGAVAVVLARHLRGAGALAGHLRCAGLVERGVPAPGGILIGDAAGYDLMARLLLGSFYDGVAADVATRLPRGARVLDVGCGPGHLATRLARDHGLEVTGLDLDPAMVERARAASEQRADETRQVPEFVVGDAADLPFEDRSFDAIVTTLSMHHWSDVPAGVAEIARVLRPGGRGLLWDLRPGRLPFHGGLADPLSAVRASPARIVRADPWPWPWRLALTQRIEIVPPGPAQLAAAPPEARIRGQASRR